MPLPTTRDSQCYSIEEKDIRLPNPAIFKLDLPITVPLKISGKSGMGDLLLFGFDVLEILS